MSLQSVLKTSAMAAVLALPLFLAPNVDAKVFRFANDGDVSSMDPYARQETFLLTFTSNIYEPLARRDENLKLEPALATSWENTSPNVWRFHLRHGVKWQDGTPFTAADVVFSLERANGPGSNLNSLFSTYKSAKAVDDYTVDVELIHADPVFVDKMRTVGIMSKAWCEKHNAVHAAEMTKNEENYATRNAMGTGPFMLKSREPDVRTVLVANPNWWDKPKGNVTEVQFSRINNDATRVAALLSGEIDFVYTVPPQDVERLKHTDGIKVLEKQELRTVFLGMDQARDQLLESSVKGKNPFKDIRVRRAFYQAIDEDAIVKTVMRGQATATALMIGPGIHGFSPELNKRYPYDPNASKKLLAEAGYPNGFEVGMDCPNDRYVNDEAICQAVVAMLARVGVKVNLLAQTRSKYFAKILSYNTSFYMLGWTPGATYDAHNAFEPLMQTRDPKRKKGQFNVGGWSNKKFDELADKIEVETDPKKRDAMIYEANKIHKEEFGHIPLHQQELIWAMRSNIDVAQLADNYFPLRYVVVH